MSRKGRRGRAKDGGSLASTGRGHDRQKTGTHGAADSAARGSDVASLAQVQGETPAPPAATSAASGGAESGPGTRPAEPGGLPVVEAPPPTAPEPTPLAFASPAEPARHEVEPARAPAAPERPEPDDSTVPPVGDIDAHFFRSSRPPPHSHDSALDLDERDPRAAQRMTARAAQRRAYLARYVTGAVAIAAALCVIALLKSAFGHADDRPSPTARPAQGHENPLPAAEGSPAAPVVAAVASVAERQEPPPEVPSAKESPPVPAPAPSESAAPPEPVAAASSAPPAEAPPPSPAAVAADKAASRVALERGRLAAAIEAGERAVAADPGDGESWLILGAAYQQKGDWMDARRCYKACVDHGVRGPTSECAAMLR